MQETLPVPFSNARNDLAGCYARLNMRAQQRPTEPARRLHIAGTACGWVTQAACDALRALPQVVQGQDGLGIMPEGVPSPALDACLATVAQTLRDAECLRGWRNELLDVHAEAGVIGKIERAACRPLGLRTRAVHLSAWTPTGDLWIARRSMSKSTDPGMWDTLVGGLVGAGEDPDQALVRECAEEAGLTEPDIAERSAMRTILCMHRQLPEGYQVEDLMVAHCVLSPGVVPRNCDGEVSEIKTVTRAEALAMVHAGAFTLEAALVIVEDMMRAG